MSSIASTIQSVLDRTGYSAYASNGTVGQVEAALVDREQAIAEQIVGAVVDEFGVREDDVRVRLSATGMSVRLPEFTSALDEAEGEIEEDEDDEDEADALFTEPDEDTRQPESAPEQTGGDDLAEAVTALIRAITARLA